MDEAIPAGDSQGPPQPELSEAAKILFEEPEKAPEDGEAVSESEQPSAALDESSESESAEG